MSICSWSGIIYARTYNVDFRFIATPEGYSDDDIYEIEPYILTSTRLPEELPNQWRWSLFRNKQQCVFGVTCMASDLIGAAEATGDSWVEMTYDNTRVRQLYLFVGYVSNQESAAVPTFEKLNLSLFAPLYQYVADCWLVKPYEELSRTTIKIPYGQPNWAVQDQPALDEENSSVSELFTSLKKACEVCLVPDTDEPRKMKIWNTAANEAVDISVCFGLRRERDALNSPFIIASLPIEKETIKKARPTGASVQPEELTSNNNEQVKAEPDEETEHQYREGSTITQIFDKVEHLPDRIKNRTEQLLNNARVNIEHVVDDTLQTIKGFITSENKTQDNEPVTPPHDFLKKSANQKDAPNNKKNEPQSPWDLD